MFISLQCTSSLGILFFFFPKKDSLKVNFNFYSVFFSCISLKSISLDVASKDFKNKVRISGISKDNGSFTSTKFSKRFLVALQFESPC